MILDQVEEEEKTDFDSMFAISGFSKEEKKESDLGDKESEQIFELGDFSNSNSNFLVPPADELGASNERSNPNSRSQTTFVRTIMTRSAAANQTIQPTVDVNTKKNQNQLRKENFIHPNLKKVHTS